VGEKGGKERRDGDREQEGPGKRRKGRRERDQKD
jgi:hypothetical protein